MRMGGTDDLYVAGHIHTHAMYQEEDSGSGRIKRGLQLASYKKIDDFARSIGAARVRHGEAVLVVVDAASSVFGRVTPFWDIEKGEQYLNMLHGKGVK